MAEELEKPAPVRAPEVVASILAALAIEEVARAGIERFAHGAGEQLLIERVGWLGLSLLWVAAIVRILHGNSIYLASRYARWSSQEIPKNSSLAIPLHHLFDVFFSVLEYAALLGAAVEYGRRLPIYVAGSPPGPVKEAFASLNAPMGWTAAAFGIHLVWVIARKLSSSMEDERALRTLNIWCWIDVCALLGLLAGPPFLRLYGVGDGVVPWLIAVILIGTLVCDYIGNYSYLFEPRDPSDLVSVDMSAASLEYAGALFAVVAKAHQRLQNIPAESRKAAIQEELDNVFWFFMENWDNRTRLFRRNNKARLHAGIYLFHENALHSFYRSHDVGIELVHRQFVMNESYIGHAFHEGRYRPGLTFIYHRVDSDLALRMPGIGGIDRKHAKFYKSSVLTNIFLRATDAKNQPYMHCLGTVLVTSDREGHFTAGLHESMILAVSRALAELLQAISGESDAKKVCRTLQELFNQPFVFKVAKGKS